MEAKRYRIGVLLYFRHADGRVLLIRRRNQPNVGLWCAVGGKLEMKAGESPFQCAKREAMEEVGVELEDRDLMLRCILSEKDYEKTGHWLMFLFEVKKSLSKHPKSIKEGDFKFFEIEDLRRLEMPMLDKEILLDRILAPQADRLHVLRAECKASEEGISLKEDELIK